VACGIHDSTGAIMTHRPMTVTSRAFARAGLIGNPSDGYFGKTISLIVKNFRAEVTLRESDELIIEPDPSDRVRCDSLDEFAMEIQRLGYYGGMRLVKAAIQVFWRYCRSSGVVLEPRNFTLSYRSDIPRLVGLAGSSAIVTACLKALMCFYGIEIPMPILPNIVLAAEREELGICAGLQDRVIQAYEGVMFMDFDRSLLDTQGYGNYQRIDPKLLPPLYLAYDPERAEGSERTHNDLRARFEAGEAKIVDVMRQLADLAEQGKTLLLKGRGLELKPLMNRGFDLRREICPISEANLRMIETARSVGASSQFAGSGGAIIGIHDEETMYPALQKELNAIGCIVLKPTIT
jgi:glucuronokinase